ncbi:hydroxyacid dehydrogenase [Candidatus Latescibacterota bacterium]
MADPHIFFMAPPGETQDWFWRSRARGRARELGYHVRLNDRPAPTSPSGWSELLPGVEALLTTWGSPKLNAEVLSQADALRIVGHVGGSVAPIVSPELFRRGVRVCTANPLMARSVAEYSLMMTLVGLRRLVRYARIGGGGNLDWEVRKSGMVPEDAVIGIWGYGDVARWLIRLLRPLEPRQILVHDEYLGTPDAEGDQVTAVSFDELFARSDLVHCLTGLTAANRGRVGRAQLAALRHDAVLVNCGRAALIQEEALIAALRENRFTAIMDVFEEEPLAPDHPYRSMPNVVLTPHNAGYGRDGQYLGAMLEEFDRFFRGEPLQYEVTPERALAMTDPALMRGRA